MSRLGWIVVAAVWLACGCDEGGESAPAREPPPAAIEPELPPQVPAEDPPTEPSTEDRAAMQRQIDQALRLLRDARHRLRRGQTERAIATLRESVRAHPLAAAQCELGWALFRQNQLDEARPLLEGSVRQLSGQARLGARERNTLGACLYNLGRVEEQAQDFSAAADAYRRSLSVRDNRVVRSRLTALGDDAPPPPDPDCAPLVCEGPASTLQAAMERARASIPVERSGDGSISEVRAQPRRVSDQPALHAATFAVRTGRWSGPEYNFVAVQTDAGWFACRVGGGTGVGESFDGLREIHAVQIIPGGAPELHVGMSYAYQGWEEGINNTMGTEETAFVGIESDRPVVYGVVQTGDFYDDAIWTDCDAECEAEHDDPSECCELEDISTRTSYDVVDGPAGVARFRLSADSRGGEDPPVREFDVPLRTMRCGETPTGRSRL